MEKLQAQLVLGLSYQRVVNLFLAGLALSLVATSLVFFPQVPGCSTLSWSIIQDCSIPPESTLPWKLSVSSLLLIQCSIPLIIGHLFITKLRSIAPSAEPHPEHLIPVSLAMWTLISGVLLIALSLEFVINYIPLVRNSGTVFRMLVFILNSIFQWVVHQGLAYFWGYLPPKGIHTAPLSLRSSFVRLDAPKDPPTLQEQGIILLYHRVTCRFSMYHIPMALISRLLFFYLFNESQLTNEGVFLESTNRITVEASFFIWSFILAGRCIQFALEASLPLIAYFSIPLPSFLIDWLSAIQGDRTPQTWFVMFILFSFAMSFGWKNPYIPLLATFVVLLETHVFHTLRKSILGVVPSQEGAFIPWLFHRDMTIVAYFINVVAMTTLPIYETWACFLVLGAFVYIYSLRAILKSRRADYMHKAERIGGGLPMTLQRI